MPMEQKRNHPRTECEVPILFSPSGSSHHYHGTLRNYSNGGLYFESFFALPEGSYIIIKADTNKVPDPGHASVGDLRELEVRWFMEIPNTSPTKYGCGLQYLTM